MPVDPASQGRFLALVNGFQVSEFAGSYRRAGFRFTRVVPTPTLFSIVEGVPDR